MKNKLWMRKIKVTLTSMIPYENGKYGVMVFGDDTTDPKFITSEVKLENPSITINGKKTAASLQDNGVVVITNLSYSTIAKMTLYKFFLIKIEIGYQDNNFVEIFNGEVSYISQKIYSKHDTETYITYASHLVAAYSQNRINFTANSGITLYTCIQQISMLSGLPAENISEELKKITLTMDENYSGSASSLIEKIMSENKSFTLSTDGTNGTVIDITTVKDKRVIVIDNKNIPIGSGNPTLSSGGVDITLIPTCNFKVGDILKLDNAMLNIAISSPENVGSTFNQNYLDKNGLYMIYYIEYTFQNRGDQFQYNVKARALDVIQSMTGGI